MLAGNLLVGRLVTFLIPRFLRRLQRPENKENSEICRQMSKKVHKDTNGNKTTNINTIPNTNIHKYKHTRGQKYKYNNHKPTHRRKTETQL